MSQALAEASTNTSYIMIPSTQKGGDPYQVGPPENVWYNYEFPTLQRNTAIDQVIGVDNKAPWKQKVAFKRGDKGAKVLDYKDADTLSVPPRCKGKPTPTPTPPNPIGPPDFGEGKTTTAGKVVKPTGNPNPIVVPEPVPVVPWEVVD